MRTRCKICGITRVADALTAARAGADAIGLVFYPGSPRCVSSEQARAIAQALPPLVTIVGLFKDQSASEVAAVLAAVPLTLLQFHGSESAEFCRQFGKSYFKAIAMGRAPGQAGTIEEIRDNCAAFPDAAALLFDSHAPGAVGGSGATFDWKQLPALSRPWLLAGGLTPQNVAAAIRTTRPYGVDVSSGVESAPGIKDAAKLQDFIAEVQRAG